jgi:hypothetical protein
MKIEPIDDASLGRLFDPSPSDPRFDIVLGAALDRRTAQLICSLAEFR